MWPMKRMAMDVIDRKVEVIGNLSRNSALYRHVLALSYAMLGVQMNPKLVCPPGTRNEWCVCECVCVCTCVLSRARNSALGLQIK